MQHVHSQEIDACECPFVSSVELRVNISAERYNWKSHENGRDNERRQWTIEQHLVGQKGYPANGWSVAHHKGKRYRCSQNDSVHCESVLLINEKVKRDNWKDLFNSICKATNYVFTLKFVGQNQHHCNASAINSHDSFANLPNEVIVDKHKGTMRKVRLHSNNPWVVEVKILE